MKVFGRKGAEPEAAYGALRKLALDLTPDQLSAPPEAVPPVLAVLMETGFPGGVATLVGIFDGATSLYFSSGGGFIGAGGHPQVAEATQRWVEQAAAFVPQLSQLSDPPPPTDGSTQFVAVTPEGLLGAVVPEEELGEGHHPLSPLFSSGQAVITQIRLHSRVTP